MYLLFHFIYFLEFQGARIGGVTSDFAPDMEEGFITYTLDEIEAQVPIESEISFFLIIGSFLIIGIIGIYVISKRIFR